MCLILIFIHYKLEWKNTDYKTEAVADYWTYSLYITTIGNK